MAFLRATWGGIWVCRCVGGGALKLAEAELDVRRCAVDRTAWDTLLTTHDTATQEYVDQLPPASASLVRMRALFDMDKEVLKRGASYPFCFGDQKTNGMLTAFKFVLGNAAVALYAAGTPRDACMQVAPLHGRVHRLLVACSRLDSAVLTRDAGDLYGIYVGVAALARLAAPGGDFASLCERTARAAYFAAFVTARPVKLSESLTSEVKAACQTGKSLGRVGGLVLKRVRLEIVARATVEEAHPAVSDADLLADLMERCDRGMKRMGCVGAVQFS